MKLKASFAKLSSSAILLFAALLGGPFAVSVTLDLETHDALIVKLQEVKSNLSTVDGSYAPTTLRIADLLADRARLLDLKSMEETRQGSEQAKNDRAQAILLISQVEHLVSGEQKSRALAQKAQLLQLTGKVSEAQLVLQQIRKTVAKGNQDYWVATDMLADIHFSKGEFDKASVLYKEIQSSSKKNDYVIYRLAWCDLNLKKEAQAVQSLEALLDKGIADEGLRREATRDLAIFYSRRPYNANQIDKIKHYSGKSPEDLESNLKLFSEELKRLGRKKESAYVLIHLLKVSPRSEQSLASQSELFENYVHIQQFNEGNKVLEKIVSQNCGEQCKEIQNRIHRTLRGWATEEGKKPSGHLMNAFQIYSRMNPLDSSAILFGVKAAQDANQHQVAMGLLMTLIEKSNDKASVETSLKAMIGSAEKVKDPRAREQAYRLYLRRGQDETLKKEIVGELVASLIQSKQFSEAESFALQNFKNTKQDIALGEQILEIYRLTGDAEKERAFSLRLAGKDQNNQYFKNYKRLSLASTKQRIDQGKASSTDLTLLIQLAESPGSSEEKYKILSDAFLVAMKSQDFAQMKDISDRLVVLSSRMDSRAQKLAFEKRMLVADLELDFLTSLRYDRKLSGAQPDRASVFRMAVKARLAGQPDRGLESKILSGSGYTTQQRTWVLENQIIQSSNPLSLLKSQQSWLRSQPEIHSRLALMAYGRTSPAQMGNYVRSQPSLKNSLVGLLVERRGSLARMKQFVAVKLQKGLQYGSLSAFNSSLERQITAIQSFEKQFMAKSQDPISLMIAHGYWMLLNVKLADQLEMAKSRLRAPETIKAQLNAGIDTQVSGLRAKISDSETQILSLWNSHKVEPQLEEVLRRSHPLQRDAIVGEIQAWKDMSSGALQRKWAQVLDDAPKSRVGGVESLYSSLRRNPFSVDKARELARKEEERGNVLMSLFLTEREQKVKGGI